MNISRINCEHPSFVLNPQFFEYFVSLGTIYYQYEDQQCSIDYQNYSHFTKEYLRSYIYRNIFPYVNQDNMDNFYFCDKHGSIYPLFYLFACGKCSLCRSRKSAEYVFRAACESRTYPEGQYFVTLTYNDKNLPADGVQRSHLQLFFKRLRWRLKSLDLPTDFRYLAVSEYGSKTGRPHYHIMFWNLAPTQDIIQINRLIKLSWCNYLLDADGHRCYSYSSKNKRWYPKRRSIGFSMILPIEKGCAAYVTKYFRKGSNDDKRNKTFLLSSHRNGGIGSQYIKQHYDAVCNNFAYDSISVSDIRTGRIFSYPIAGYVKYCLFPPKSCLFRKHKLYDKLKGITNNVNYLEQLILHYRDMTRETFHLFHWSTMKQVYKGIRHFFTLHKETYLRKISTYLRHLSSDDIVSEIARVVDMIKNEALTIDFNELFQKNRLFDIRFKFNDYICRNRINRYYDIDSSVYYEEKKYTNYKLRCTF
ncbi:replication initiator protein [Dipodfec virus UOA04_Rod_391]|nr:replication initiator protein [Dipodfec virus UOA04_Rod_391]